ncbi:Gfo/Idh/MocA family oxidoreductase [Exiguobacterium sp. K1]|uniref:Gfo/Idh/MocA family protein n=1 Tax=Exiguobacterium sp. K1 TaxID=2980105 RepID=UPI00299EDE2A|nr:Gfo/Idh/MocA family oxidoreductase [Exiguobacterium sp. K1]MDX1260559.1 Gfo/Idh/MocA family oxidoreductase [Exiguobacterium sp. K1]
MRAALIGAGFHARTNLFPGMKEAGFEIVAVTTRSLESAERALRDFGSAGRAYTDYTEMLTQEQVEAVIICLQPADQVEVVRSCLAAGCAVYVEKPLGLSVRQAEELAGLVTDQVTSVGFMKRYAPVYTKLKQVLVQNTYGNLRSFELRFACDASGFCHDRADFLSLAAIHQLDLIRFLAGEVEEITGMSLETDGELHLQLSLRMKNGAVGQVTLINAPLYTREVEELTLRFEQAVCQVEEMQRLIIEEKQEPTSWQELDARQMHYRSPMSTMSGGMKDLYLRGFVGEMNHFKAAVEGGDASRSDFQDNVKTMQLIQDILDTIR